jgi:hypothetical protein
MRRDDPLDPGTAAERAHDLTRATVAHRPAELAATEATRFWRHA